MSWLKGGSASSPKGRGPGDDRERKGFYRRDPDCEGPGNNNTQGGAVEVATSITVFVPQMSDSQEFLA